MKPYVYQEYPKCLYKGEETCTVANADDEKKAAKQGWKTAAQHHQYADPKKDETA